MLTIMTIVNICSFFGGCLFIHALCVCVGGVPFQEPLVTKKGVHPNQWWLRLSLSIYIYIHVYIYITLAYTYTHTFGASPANGLIPSIFRLVNDETSPSMGKNPVPGPGRSKWAQFFGAASSCYRALWHPCTCKAWFLVCGGILSNIVAKLGDENWPLEGHLRWSVLFTIFIICKVFRRYLPLFDIFTNLRTDKSLRTIWFILGCNLLIGYWGWICTYKLTIPIKSAQENGTKQGWHQWMFAVFVLISNFQLTSHDISDFVPWPTKHMTEEMGRHPNKSREFRRTYLKNPRIGALYETLPLTCWNLHISQ